MRSRATSSGAPPARAGRNRSGTSSSARGRVARRPSSTTGGFDADERFDLLQRLGVTVLCQAPTEYRLMAKLPTMARFDLSRAPPRRVGRRAAQSRGDQGVPRRLRPDRSTTATGRRRTRCSSRTRARWRSSLARWACRRRVTMSRDRRATEREPPVGTEGDIALRGRPPSLVPRLLERARGDERRASAGSGIVTGDRATRDEDGYLWFTGRADDVILSAALPDRALRGRERAPRAPGGCRERRGRQAGCRPRRDRQGIRRASIRASSPRTSSSASCRST